MSEPYRVPVMEADRSKAGLAVHLVATATGLSAERISAREQRRDAHTRARRLAMYLSHIAFGWPLERVGHVFGVHRATAGQACRWVEDERDRPELDALLDRLESLIAAVFEAPRCELPQ